MDKPRIKTLANEIAARVAEMLDAEIERLGGMDKVSEKDVIDVYRMLAAEVFSLRVNVPGWQALKPKKTGADVTNCRRLILHSVK